MKKKFLTVLLAFVAVLCLCFGLAACGGGASVAGRYYLYENGQYDKANWIELKDGAWETSASGGEPASSGDYEVNGEQIVLYIDLLGSKQIFSQGTVKNGVLTLTTMGVTRSFYKEGAAGGSQSEPGGGTNGGTNTPSTGQTYTVTYNANGGKFTSGETFAQQVQGNSALTAPASPSRQNYTFAGWAKDKNGSEMWDFSKDKVTGNTTLYAIWAQKSATVLSVEGASIEGANIFMLVTPQTAAVQLANKVVCSDDSYWQLYYDALGQTEIPTKVAANLGGALADGENVFYIVVTSQDRTQVNTYVLTVYRQYTVNVTYMTNGAVYNTREIVTGTPLSQSYDIPCTVKGYTFNGWKHTEEFGAAVWGPVTFTADLTANTYKVTFDSAGGSDVAEKTVTFDKSYSFSSPSRTGYTFLGWWAGSTQLTNASGALSPAWNIDSDTKVTAHWQVNKYQLTVKADNSSAGSVTGGGEYDYDSNVTVTATTNQGYNFLGWYNQNGTIVSDEARYTFQMGLATTLTAKWDYYTVTVSRNNTSAGTLSQSYNGTKITVGTKVSVTATTNKGYTWVGWYSGEAELTAELTYSFTMERKNVNAEARWSKTTVTKSHSSAGSVTALDGTYAAGDKVTLTATTNVGYTFIGWYKGEDEVTTEPSYQLTMGKEDETYEARWELNVEMEKFNFTSTPTTCTVTGLKDETATEITIPDCVTGIGNYAFYHCDGLTSVTIGSGVTSIGSWAFDNCDRLMRVDITDLAAWCKIDFGDNPLYYAHHLYLDGEEVTTLTIPEEITQIKAYAFWGCTGLTSVTIRSGSIGDSAFSGCDGLTSVTIGNGVTSIESYAFSSCTGLEHIEVALGNNVYLGEQDCLIEKNTNTLILGCKNSVIPDGVTSIGDRAFYHCEGLASVTIPDGVTSIGDRAFCGCKGLTSVTIPDSVTSIGKEAFHSCYGLTSVTIPDSVTSIGKEAFHSCYGLTSVTIPKGVTSIGDDAFCYCYKLIEVWNHSRLSIRKGADTYGYVAKYAKHVYTGNEASKQTVTDDGYIFYEDGEEIYLLGYRGTETALTLPDKTPTGKNYAIYQCAFYHCDGLTGIEIPDSVTSIGSSAFYGTAYYNDLSHWENGEVLYIGNHFITVKDTASAYTSVFTIRSGTKTIASNAFSGLMNLRSVTIPNSVTAIGERVFGLYNYEDLTDIQFKGTVEEWQAIKKGSDWDYYTSDYTVTCTNGKVSKSGKVTYVY